MSDTESPEKPDTGESVVGNSSSKPKRVGRPKKGKLPVGRPKGEASIMLDYKRRMLNSPKSRRVLEAIFNAALDDEHKHQAAAWKIVADRIVPTSLFEDDIKRSGGKSAVNITISGIGSGVNIEGSESAEDGEWETVNNNEDTK